MPNSRPRPWPLPVVAAIVTLASALAVPSPQPPLDGWAVTLLILMSAPLYWLTRFPAGAFAVVTAAFVVWVIAGYEGFAVFSFLAALYGLGRYARGAPVFLGASVPLVIVLCNVFGSPEPGGVRDAVVFAIVAIAILLLAVQSQTVERAQRLAEDEVRSFRQEAALRQERLRIARDVHDVVAHGLGAIVIHAAASREGLSENPRDAGEALATIEETGRDAMRELRQVLAVLRTGGSSREPAPGLEDLGALVERAARLGPKIRLQVDPAVQPISAGLGLTIYRIVQEGLTNVVRHARATTAWVDVARRGSAIDVSVRDDGCGPVDDGGFGSGLVGIAERVAAAGGDVSFGSRAAGGFELRARLNLREPPLHEETSYSGTSNGEVSA